jgi:hypothetical protein
MPRKNPRLVSGLGGSTKVEDSRQKQREILQKMMPAKPKARDWLLLQVLLDLESRDLIDPIETEDDALQFFLPCADSAVRRRALEQAGPEAHQ